MTTDGHKTEPLGYVCHDAPAVKEIDRLTLPPHRRRPLPNGAEMYILNGGTQPVNRLTLQWKSGFADSANPAALQLLAATLCEGTSTKSGAEITESLEYNGAWKAVENAPHTLAFSVYTLNKCAAEVFATVREIVTDARFPEESLQPIRDKLAAQLEVNLQKVSYLARKASKEKLYGEGHPMARAVTPDMLRKTTRDEILEAYRLMAEYPPEIYLSGEITPEIEELAASLFGSVEYPHTSICDLRKATKANYPTVNSEVTVEKPDSMQTAISMVIPIGGIDGHHPDYERLRIAVKALGGYFGSRLMSNIREEKGYTYGISAALSSTPECTFIQISTEGDNRYANLILNEIEKEITRLAEEPMDQEELSLVRNTQKSDLASVLDTPFDISSYYRQLKLKGLSESHYEYQFAEADAITASEITDLIRRYLLTAPRIVAMAGNPA